MLLSSVGWGQEQTWTYDFNVAAATHASGVSTDFFPSTPAGGGTYRVRIGSGGGELELDGNKAIMGASTSTSANKVGVYGWDNPTTAAYVKFKVITSSSDNGRLAIALGNDALVENNTNYSNNYNASLAIFWINYSGGDISSVQRRDGGSNINISDHGFVTDIEQTIEVYGNNSDAVMLYERNETAYTLDPQSWDLWVAGTKISPEDGWGIAGNLAANNDLSGFVFFGESSTANAATITLDDYEYANHLPQPEIEDPILFAAPASLDEFSYVESAGPAAAMSFELTGENLDESDVTATAPAGFQVSTEQEAGFDATLTLSAYDGNTVDIWVRLASGLAVGDYSGNVAITGGGADQINVAVSGRVVDPFSIPFDNDFRSQADVDLAVIQGFDLFDYDIHETSDPYYRFVSPGSFIKTPEINFTAHDYLLTSFDLRNYGTGSNRELSVMISDDGSDWTTIEAISLNSSSFTTFEVTIDLTGAFNVASGWIKYEMTDGTGGIRFRDLIISELPDALLIGAADDAANYTESDFISQGNLGFGFDNWFEQSNDGGYFRGQAGEQGVNSAQIDTDGNAFGLWATDYSDVGRLFGYSLADGHSFSFTLAYQFDNGNKGFSLLDGNWENEVFNWNVNDAGYTWTGGSAATTPWEGDRENGVSFEFTFTQNGNNLDYAFSSTAGNGPSGSGSVADVSFDRVKFYVSGAGGGSGGNLYFNSLDTELTDPGKILKNVNLAVTGQVELSHNLEVENLIIDPGNLLRLRPATTLDVTGLLTNNTGTSGLLIQSDASGTGSLIHSTADVPATIERYINGGGYHLVSVPLTGGATAGLFMHSYLYEFDAGAQEWVIESETPEDPIDTDKGYMIWYTGTNTTYSFGGSMNSGTFEPQINSGAAAELFNLVPNPYPSALDWDAADGWTKENLVDAIYIWNRQAANGENPNGQWASYIDGASTNGGSRFIPVGQSFFVETDGNGAPDLAMNNDVRVHSDQAFFKNQQEIPDMLRIHAQTEQGTDEMVVRLHRDATDAFDSQFDASKIYGSSALPQLYSISADGRKLSINTLPLAEDATVVPVALEWESDAEVTLAFSNLHSFEPALKLFLEDLLTGEMIELREQSNYTFIHSESNHALRFNLHLYDVVSVDEFDALSTHHIWNHNNRMYVSIPSHTGEHATIELFDLLGKKLVETDLKLEDPVSLHVPANGIVIVRVTTGNEVYTNKLFIR